MGNHFAGGVSAASMLVSATSSNAILGGQQLAQAVDVSCTCALGDAVILTMTPHFMSMLPVCI